MPPVVAAGAETASRVALPFADQISLPSRHRNRERERAADTRRAFHFDPTTVRLDCQLAERQSETAAAPSRIELTELLKDPLERCRRNPLARIADCEPDVFFVALRHGNGYSSASRELDGIGEEVDERTTQFVLITRKVRQSGGDVRDECRARLLSECGNLLECACHERSRRELDALELRRSRFHLLDIEEIVDHCQERLAATGGDGHQLTLRFVQPTVPLQHVDAGDHRRKWRPKIVYDHVANVVAEPLGLLQSFVIFLQLVEESVFTLSATL